VNIPKGWRELKTGETIKAGDRYSFPPTGRWYDVEYSSGIIYRIDDGFKVIRKVKGKV
jgi:hypothetical protein